MGYCRHEEHSNYGFGEMDMFQQVAILFSLGCVIIATALSIYLIYMHMSHYTNPEQQKHLVRIILMVPIFAVDSWCSLWFNDLSLYFDVARDCYEAVVLWEFFALLMSYLGGEEQVQQLLKTKPPMKHPFPFCFAPPFVPSARRFLARCKQCILQYVVIMPTCAIVTFILEVVGVFCNGEFRFTRGYLYITFILNVSVTVSLYFLVLFYITVEEELKPYKPLPKFIAIKAILFFSFWQAVFLSFLAAIGIIKPFKDWNTTDVGATIDNFLITLEMMVIAVCHRDIFPWEPYDYVVLGVNGQPVTQEDSDVQPQFGVKKHQSFKSTTSKFLKSVANPYDMLKETHQSFNVMKKTRSKGAKDLARFHSASAAERKAMIVKHGWMKKISGAVMLRWKRYYIFLLRDPCGICWFPNYPFKDSEAAPKWVDGPGEIVLSEEIEEESEEESAEVMPAGVDGMAMLEEGVEMEVVPGGDVYIDEAEEYSATAAPKKPSKLKQFFTRRKKAKRWLPMESIVRVSDAVAMGDMPVVKEGKDNEDEVTNVPVAEKVLEIEAEGGLNFLLRFANVEDKDKYELYPRLYIVHCLYLSHLFSCYYCVCLYTIFIIFSSIS